MRKWYRNTPNHKLQVKLYFHCGGIYPSIVMSLYNRHRKISKIIGDQMRFFLIIFMYKQNDWNWKRRVDPFPLIFHLKIIIPPFVLPDTFCPGASVGCANIFSCFQGSHYFEIRGRSDFSFRC